MPAVADPDTMKLDAKIAPIDLSAETSVAGWFRALRARGINFHPEESFAVLVNGESGQPLFSAEYAERLDALMGLAYEVCDPCGVALRLIQEQAARSQPNTDKPPPEVRESEYGGKIDVVGMPHQDALHNLAVLHQAGVLVRRRQGRMTLYADLRLERLVADRTDRALG